MPSKESFSDPRMGLLSLAEQSFRGNRAGGTGLCSVLLWPQDVDSSVAADQLTRLTLKLLVARQLGTCAFNSLLQNTALTGKIIPVTPTSQAKQFCMVLAL